MPGDKYRSIKRPDVYRALRRQGMDKSKAAAIANAVANGTIDRKAKVFYDAHGNELDIRDDMIDWSTVLGDDEDEMEITEKERADLLDERLEHVEQQLAMLVEATRAVAAATVKERKVNQQLIAAVKVLIGDMTEQVTEKSRSVTVGDTTFDISAFSNWAEETAKEVGDQIPAGLQEFSAFVTGQQRQRRIPRT